MSGQLTRYAHISERHQITQEDGWRLSFVDRVSRNEPMRSNEWVMLCGQVTVQELEWIRKTMSPSYGPSEATAQSGIVN